MKIALSLIQGSPSPIRTTWDEDKLNELAQSLKEQGLIQPIKVRPLGDEYEIVYGHRRVEAARRAGFDVIEVIVEGMDDEQALIQALIENIQREDMNNADEGAAYKALQQQYSLTTREIARRTGKDQAWIARLITLVDDPVKDVFIDDPDHQKDAGVKTAILRSELGENVDLRKAVAKKAVDENLSREQIRRVAQSVAAAPGEHAKQVLIDQPYSQFRHDPEFIKERADKFGAHDPIYSRTERSTLNEDWQATPEVSNVIALMRSWMGSLTEFRKADELGKMSPEARGFVGRRVRQFAEALLEWADKLEGEDE